MADVFKPVFKDCDLSSGHTVSHPNGIMSDTTEAVVEEEDQKSSTSSGGEELWPRSGHEDDDMPAKTSCLSPPPPSSQLVAAKDKEISQLEEMVNEKSSTIKQLEEKLNRQKDYETIKRELSLLKSEVAQLKSSVSSDGDHKSLEMFLIEKAKALQSENAALKAANVELSGHPHRHPLLSSFLPGLAPLQNVEAFSSLLGEEIANTYAKIFAKAQAESGSTHLPSLSSTPDRRVVTSPSRPASADDARSTESDESPLLSSSNNNNNNLISSPSKDEPANGVKTSPVLPKLEPLGSPTTTASLEKLQSQLRQNVEKFMSENLNTMNISRCVRELLSVHNIGQRLFAKYVLGLSQGTVSELLSKPKPWDKLTEKGRDSYRKMHAWAADEKCIYQLKSLVPRKGKESSFKQDDPAAEERIQAILSEAQRAMITPRTNGIRPPPQLIMTNGEMIKEREIIKDDNSSENGDDQRSSPSANPAAAAYANFRKLFKKEGSDQVPPEMVARIYQEELAKLIGQQPDDVSRSLGHTFDRSQDEIRQALAIYHQEISRLSHLANISSSFGSSATPEAFARFTAAASATAGGANGGGGGFLAGRVETRSRDRTSSSHSEREEREDSMRHSSAFSLVRPKLDEEAAVLQRSGSKRFCPSSPCQSLSNFSISNNNNNISNAGNNSHNSESAAGAEDLSAAASPLQRMQSITNSLLSQTSLPSAPQTSQRPAKAVLPPITQQQFDQYNNLNTEDIVKHVKEQLSQYSISQRLFGESVLGLSQGSVSDLLARPKPWHMLTQKGREPFIRMKMFLEDDGAVHKLVASQYKIAPEKLMRTTGFIAGPTGPPVNVHSNSSPSSVSSHPHHHQRVKQEPNSRISAMTDSVCKAIEFRQNLSPNIDASRSAGSTPELTPHSLSNSMASVFSGLQQHALSTAGNRNRGVLSVTNSSPRSTTSYPQPSVYEMAALTTDLDTQSITTKIKETLMAHNIGQKIFGEVVLGLSQGSVSELLSKPKPWHMLSIKGREPFIRMQLWLSDTSNIEKLQTLKNERREANKRRRTNTDTDGIRPPSTRDSPLYNFNSNSGGYSPLSGQSYPQNLTSSYGQSAAKKPRILFSEEQKEALKLAFSMDPYPTPATIEFLASELGLSVRTITNWFHNHRMRLKQVPASGSSDPDSALNSTAFGLTRDGVTFDTVQFRMSLAQRLVEVRAKGLSRGQEKSKFHGIFGSAPLNSQMYGNPNSCSSPGSSTQGDDDAGTLDLSMTSHNHDRISSGRKYVEDSDRSQDSLDDDNDSDTGPLERDMHQTQAKTGSGRRKPQIVTSSSSRRKPAQPQWVDPGLEFAGDEDEDDLVDDADSGSEPEESGRMSPDTRSTRREVINGVCIRQSAAEKKANQDASRKSKISQDWEDDDNDSISGDGRGVRT